MQLQVVLHDGSASTFQFSNKKGHVFQKQDRDVVKELLQQLLSKFRSKISMELEAKNKYVAKQHLISISFISYAVFHLWYVLIIYI